MKVPNYRTTFAAIPLAGGGFALTFTPAFAGNLRKMMVDSSNEAAAFCIENLGYGWINGALASGAFFDPGISTGVWLAGTFTGSRPRVRIPSVNDGGVAQAMTCFDMANLCAHVFARTLFEPTDAGACDEIMSLMFDAQTLGPDPAFITRPTVAPPGLSYAVTNTKIGLGPLKRENGGFDVASEASFVEHVDTGAKFLVVWQNSRNDRPSLTAVSFIVDTTIRAFLGLP